MANIKSQENWKRTALRLPEDLHKQVQEQALAEDRTFNGQIVAFLRECIKTRQQEEALAQQT